ncbi:hypothetical protein BU24DRAFT_441254 [Aaosphaeria arxii CBS 175.79]|uniref:Tat pathway signal sequence n=1 Tax=Aaosphaeria arxii CBS 175.79 TaxID=1450172 RepID=A0A6A5XSC5_9PLEO|nr:uncharacterized protein BU24DRAFT_441254 [Aaosphaeria arxii CBS 175.79]KAF2015661.1 hypothetical protein BU24DRAFT_441254 [Aaosphaeria arxii CBS 175.79]
MFSEKSKRQRAYEDVDDAESTEDLLEHSEKDASNRSLRRNNSSGKTQWIVISLLLFATSILSASIGLFVGRTWLLNLDRLSIRHTSQYSPIVHDGTVAYDWIRFNGSLLRSNTFREDAGPAVDAAWKSLGADFRAVRIPADLAEKSGLASDQVKVKQEYGGGYPAHVEGLHHLHCLNLLRKSLAWNFDYYQKQGLGPFSNDGTILKHHVTHCLDILRQQLMCTVDVGVLGQVWYEPPGKPLQAFVDFNTRHKCRNFENIRDWAEVHQLPEHPPKDFLEEPKEGDRIWHTVP